MTQRPIWEQLKTLEQLQELDLRLDTLKRNKNSLPALLNALDTSLDQVKRKITEKKNLIEEIEKTNRQTRAALDLNKDRLARSTTRLESVQNSHEFQAVSKEIEQVGKMNLGLEEQMKKADVDKQAIETEISTLSEQLATSQAERDAQASAVSGQTEQLDQQIAALSSDRSGLAGQIERRILSQYDRVRGVRAGLGIVPALGGRCKGCNMIVPPQLYNMIQKGLELHACPSCHRILFVPQTKTTDEGANTSATA